jgi:hypothetical protein
MKTVRLQASATIVFAELQQGIHAMALIRLYDSQGKLTNQKRPS